MNEKDIKMCGFFLEKKRFYFFPKRKGLIVFFYLKDGLEGEEEGGEGG